MIQDHFNKLKDRNSFFKDILLILIFLFFFCQSLLPCSTFLLKKGDVILVGHNLDMPYHIPGIIAINKRNVMKTGVTWHELTTGKRDSSPPLTWTSKYASITYNPMFGHGFPDGGMNEAGLYIGEMTLMGTRFPEDSSKPKVFMMQWMQYVLDNYSGVKEVIESTSQVMLDGWNWHFFAADREGNAASIEFLDGNAVIHTGKNMPIPVLCNTKYSEEMRNISVFSGFGGKKAVSLSDRAIPRFVHAAHMIKEYEPSKGGAVDYGFKILNQLDRGGTQWSLIFDLKNLRVYFHTAQATIIRYLRLESFDLSCDSPAKLLDIHADLEGNVQEDFKDYSLVLNKDFIKKGLDMMFLKSSDFKNFITSQGSTLEMFIERLAKFPENTKCKK